MINELYKDVERIVRPILIRHARRVSVALGIPIDDAIQELSIELFKSLSTYDYNKSKGRIHHFVNAVIRNSSASIIVGANSTFRVPHLVINEDGKLKTIKCKKFIHLDELAEDIPSYSDDPETALSNRELNVRRSLLRMKLFSKLNQKETQIFRCLTQPSESFVLYLKNIGKEEPSISDVGRYLGLGKNVVDYSYSCVKRKFTHVAESEFKELIEIHIDRGDWPMFHVSREPYPDHEFSKSIIKTRNLDPRPLDPAREIDISGQWGREIHWYPWGAVLFLMNRDQWRTVVVEGEFSPKRGLVLGVCGTRKFLSDEVPWYPKLVREIGRR